MAPWDNDGVQTLFVASAGGHLEQLWFLRPRFEGIAEECTWVTFDTPQSRSLLEGEQRIFIPVARPRDARAAISHTRLALHVLGLGEWTNVVSTGSLPAVPFVTLARARGINCHFIDSATRVEGPSLSGSMLDRVPGVHCYSQHRWPGRPSWRYRGSVFDGFTAFPGPDRDVQRAVVTVGTMDYGFRRLIEAAAAALPTSADVLWQTGRTELSDLPLVTRPFVPEQELVYAMGKADVVICHAGVGSAIAALRAGRFPIIVARRRSYHEHVDDHQRQLAAELARRGLAIAVEPEGLTPAVLKDAASRRVVLNKHPARFSLGEPDRSEEATDDLAAVDRRPSRRAVA